MTSKSAVLVSCFNYYDIRIKYIEKFLMAHSFEVTYITSDFNHISKKHYVINRSGTIQVSALPYKKNLSVRRMVSHYFWSKKVFGCIKSIKPSLLFVILPPNSLARNVAKYRMKNKAKLIFDIFDLWPETYPLSKNVMLKFPFFIWKRMRDQYLKVADLVSVECELFENVLGLVNKGIPTKTIYPALDEVSMSVRPKWDNNIVQLAYLGSINNIIDIDTILYLVREIVCFKPVIVHVIGQGERKVEFIGGLQESGAVVEDYGVVFDLAKKKVIFDMCHLGLNIMLPNVCVGLSMKSVEYFRFGLPIINNIPFDTSAMVSTYGAGFNLEPDSITSIARQIAFMKEEEGMAMRKGAISIFIDNMSPSAITKKLEEVIDNCG